MRMLKYLRRKRAVSPMENDALSSATDMTGLIPAGLQSEDEALSYESLYPVVRQKPIEKP